MADLICNVPDCVHRQKRPLRKWIGRDGTKYYGCSLPHILITIVSDPDGDIAATAGRENMAHCAYYKPVPEEGEQNV